MEDQLNLLRIFRQSGKTELVTEQLKRNNFYMDLFSEDFSELKNVAAILDFNPSYGGTFIIHLEGKNLPTPKASCYYLYGYHVCYYCSDGENASIESISVSEIVDFVNQVEFTNLKLSKDLLKINFLLDDVRNYKI